MVRVGLRRQGVFAGDGMMAAALDPDPRVGGGMLAIPGYRVTFGDRVRAPDVPCLHGVYTHSDFPMQGLATVARCPFSPPACAFD